MAGETAARTACGIRDQDRGVNLHVKDLRIIRVEGMQENPANR